MLRRHVHRPTVRAADFAMRFGRLTRYGLDLVLWSRVARPDSAGPAAAPLAERRAPPTARPRCTSPATRTKWWSGDEGYAAVHAALFLNLQPPGTLAPVRYAQPAPSFQDVYLWDSASAAPRSGEMSARRDSGVVSIATVP